MADRAPSRFEYDLLEFLSEHEGLSVRDIYEQFGKSQGYVRGTIVKAMDRLHKKGRVRRELVEGTFLYRAVQNKADLERQLVESFVRERLGGRIGPLASFLAQGEGVDPEELRRLKELLDKMEP